MLNKVLQQFAELVHHLLLMLHERVNVAVKGYSWILMLEYLGQCFHIHTTLNGTGGKSMPQGMKTFVRYHQLFQKQFEASLIGTNGNGTSVCRHHGGRIASFLYASEDGQQLFWQWYHAPGSSGFRLVDDKSVLPVMARL